MSRKKEPEIVLHRDMARWLKLPAEIKSALISGTERVRRIRTAIAYSSKVSSMPPIRIFDVIRASPGQQNHIPARVNVFRGRHHIEFGVELDAVTASCTNEEFVRSILVHEFAHCFAFYTRVVNHVDAGVGDLLNLATTENVFGDLEYDQEMLVKPEIWFGPDDQNIIQWHDPDLDGIFDECDRLDMISHLPMEEIVDPTFKADGISIPTDVIQHVRRHRTESTNEG